MATVNKINKTIKMDLWSIIKFQIKIHCYLKNIDISNSDLECLALLALTGKEDLNVFCDTARKNKIFRSEQSARNAVNKCVKEKLILKSGDGRKRIELNPDLKIQSLGNILLDLKAIYVDDTKKA
jgi:hypothetical protein